MADDYRVSYADLSALEKAVRDLNIDIHGIQNNIHNLDSNVNTLRTEVQAQIEDVYKEVGSLKELQIEEQFRAFARQKVAELNAEFMEKFGHYGKVRKSATGILQATDIELIRNEALKKETEAAFIETPDYWLSRALLALIFWIENNEKSAEKAVKEAIVKNKIKTSLFFALISRRADRLSPCAAWLSLYFGLQSAQEVSSETIIIIDALTNGVFGNESRENCMGKFLSWQDEINQDESLRGVEISMWKSVLETRKAALPEEYASAYQMLKEYSPVWDQIKTCLEDHLIHQQLNDDFRAILDANDSIQPNVKESVDKLLSSLVTNFDGEEMPLRRELHQWKLKADYGSNWEQYWAAEQGLHMESCRFGEILKNALIQSVVVHSRKTSIAGNTKKVAAALSKDWIIEAHQNIIAEQAEKTPENIRIKIEDWEGKSADGDDETELVENLIGHLNKREQEAHSKNKMKPPAIAAAVLSALIPLILKLGSLKEFIFDEGQLELGFIFFGFGLSAAILGSTGLNIIQRRKKIESEFEAKRKDHTHVLKAALAEVFNFREEIEKHLNEAKAFQKLIAQIDAEGYLSSQYDTTRRIMLNN